MDLVFLTQVSGILKPFAWVMGKILNAIYEFFGLFTSSNDGFIVVNIALCIFVFTFVIKMLMLPLTIKQQKYSRLSSKMSPELQAIQAKYKGKKDEVSLRRQQEETQEVYAKYGTSPAGGCLPLLISLPIMFALYRVIYAVPAYVTEIGNMYGAIADSIIDLPNHAERITSFVSTQGIQVQNALSTYAVGTADYKNALIDILAKFNKTNWNDLFSMHYFDRIVGTAQPIVDNIISANNLFGLSILDTPKWNSISVIIPILAAGFQFIQGKLQAVATPAPDGSNPMGNTAKTMNTVMPIMSGVFCLMLPIGVGVYWIATAVFTIIQTLFINKYLDKADLNEMIEKNLEKSKKKKQKYGVNTGNKMASVAKTTTKTIETVEVDRNAYKKNSKSKNSGEAYKRSEVSYKASSIAANANLLARNNASSSKPAEKKDEKPVSEAPVISEEQKTDSEN